MTGQVSDFTEVLAKAIVAAAFRNPLEPFHDRITDDEMKGLIKQAVNKVYRILRLREEECEIFISFIGTEYQFFCQSWDKPEPDPSFEEALKVLANG